MPYARDAPTSVSRANQRFNGGGGYGASSAAQTSTSANVLVAGPCICSRPGAALLNAGAPRSESPETRHPHWNGAHLWSPAGVTPVTTSASHPFWEPFSHFVLFVGPFVDHGEIAVGGDHPLAGQIESWWAT